MRCLLAAIPLAIAAALALAADEPQKAAPKPQPPDQKAFRAAKRTGDPQKKVEALRAFIRQYPKSHDVDDANELIFETTAENWPDRTGELRTMAESIVKKASKAEKIYVCNDTALTLADAGVLLDMALDLSQKALKDFKEKKYIEVSKKGYQSSKMKVPDDAELERQYQKQRARFVATLGQIRVKQGDAAEGERLLKEVVQANPALSRASVALGELALKNGQDDAALDYLVSARLSGVLKPAIQKDLESLYRKRHGGSLDGFEALLDENYKKKFPEPFHLQPYQPAPARSERVVLAEVFTGSGCPPCAGADVAMDEAMERYSRKDLAVLMYHQHIPHPDPMANPSTEERASFYGVHGVPTLAIDGKTSVGGSDRSESKTVYDRIDPLIEKDLLQPAEAKIGVSAKLDGGIVKAHATVDGIKSASKELRLQIVLVEGRLRYSGENGIRFHPMVVRALAGPKGGGFPIDPAKPASVYAEFDINHLSEDLKSYLDHYQIDNERYGPFTFVEEKDKIDPRDLAIAAFVQDGASKHVLQATFVNLGPATLAANVH